MLKLINLYADKNQYVFDSGWDISVLTPMPSMGKTKDENIDLVVEY